MTGRRDWGWIRRLPSDNYQASYIGLDGARRKAPKTFHRKLDAETWLSTERRYLDSLAATGELVEWESPEQRLQAARDVFTPVVPTLEYRSQAPQSTTKKQSPGEPPPRLSP